MRYKNSFRYLAVFLFNALFSGALFAGCTPAKPKEPENVEPEITKGGTFLQWVYWEQPMSNPVLKQDNLPIRTFLIHWFKLMKTTYSHGWLKNGIFPLMARNIRLHSGRT